MLATDRKLPLSGGAEKRRYIREMFSAVAPTYDLLNRALTFGLDQRWRGQAVARLAWQQHPHGRFLDLCAGTLDLAARLANQPGFSGQVVGTDFAKPMLLRGRGKARPGAIALAASDALALPFADRSFDGATVGWGVRNLADPDAGLAEVARVLRPGARLVILESSVPRWQPFRALYQLYFDRVLPWIGRVVSRHPTAYSWLPASVAAFDSPEQLTRRLERSGFGSVQVGRLLGGVCTIHVAIRL